MKKTSLTSALTLGALKAIGYTAKSVKAEIRDNLMACLKDQSNPFEGIIGYEDSVIPETERALLSQHNILFLGLRGQAKTRMARQMVQLLDEYIPVVAGSEIQDNPFAPISKYARDLIQAKGDDTPIHWLHRSERYGEKLATPDVSVADLIGDIDPIKAAHQKLSFADELAIHYGIIPRSNRGIFVINELPDLQARIQVGLFNILQEGDIQIRGFKLRMPLDMLFVFTANPEDYTNRGSIVTPLKDRIESQILTHYPRSLESALAITEQEVQLTPEQKSRVDLSDLVKRLVEQVAFEARNNEMVDKKSGVSARLTIAALENAISSAERRAIIHGESQTSVWMTDLYNIVPAITGKIELVYEGEQEGPYQVALNLIEKSIRTLFTDYFPNPEASKKKGKANTKQVASPPVNPYQSILSWFDKGNQLNIMADTKDSQRIAQLYQVEGLFGLVKAHYPKANEKESALLMEFVLHGLAAYSLISKQQIEGQWTFRDLMGSMLNWGNSDEGEGEDLG
ncbi:MAG: magnesium chelatase [Sphingobacteriia bacterium]|nr:MAG: magnesium chelatase [Sphingobacteriia bacterium]